MKLTKELKQKIYAWFESKSEEEVYEILKGYGLMEEKPASEEENKTLSIDLLKIDDENKLKLLEGFVYADLKDGYEFLFRGLNGDAVVVKRTIVLSSAEIPMSMILK